MKHTLYYPVFFIRLIALLSVFLFSLNSNAQCQQENEQCVEISQWQLSLSIGAGTLTNPLNGGDNIPLVIIPKIHYYGENFFIENNVIGYSFYQSDDLIISAVSQLNREKAFFTDWQPSHLFISSFSESTVIAPEDEKVSKNDIRKRKWAVDAGLQINWFISQSTEIKAQLFHDINNVYNGLNGQLAFNHSISLPSFTQSKVRLAAGINWQSSDLSNYYYGISHQDQVDLANLYQASTGINPFISINYRYQLSKDWQLSLFAKHEWLGEHIADSPLIEDQHITSAFIGAVYAF